MIDLIVHVASLSFAEAMQCFLCPTIPPPTLLFHYHPFNIHFIADTTISLLLQHSGRLHHHHHHHPKFDFCFRSARATFCSLRSQRRKYSSIKYHRIIPSLNFFDVYAVHSEQWHVKADALVIKNKRDIISAEISYTINLKLFFPRMSFMQICMFYNFKALLFDSSYTRPQKRHMSLLVGRKKNNWLPTIRLSDGPSDGPPDGHTLL